MSGEQLSFESMTVIVKPKFDKKAYQKQWIEKNKEHIKNYNLEYRKKNREKLIANYKIYYSCPDVKKKKKESKKKWIIENRERHLESKNRYRKKHREKIAKKQRNYYEENKEEIKKRIEENKEEINKNKRKTRKEDKKECLKKAENLESKNIDIELSNNLLDDIDNTISLYHIKHSYDYFQNLHGTKEFQPHIIEDILKSENNILQSNDGGIDGWYDFTYKEKLYKIPIQVKRPKIHKKEFLYYFGKVFSKTEYNHRMIIFFIRDTTKETKRYINKFCEEKGIICKILFWPAFCKAPQKIESI